MTPRATAAGDLRPCTAYLMGCQAAAEKIYRRDPAVMLYAPLRTLIYIDSGDRTRFAVDQPSTVFAGFADPAIAGLGARLDQQFAERSRPSASRRTRFLAPQTLPERHQCSAHLAPPLGTAGRGWY
jgi:hypothetical protein